MPSSERKDGGTFLQSVPPSSAAFANASWADVAPWYAELAATPLDNGRVESWLATWSRIEELVTEAAAVAMISYTGDTADAKKKADHLRFATEILPNVEEQSVALARRLLATGWTRPDFETTRRRFHTAHEIFREANVPIFADLEERASIYHETTGQMTATWDGEQVPLPHLAPHLKNPDHAVRERAFHAVTGPYMAHQETLAGLFDQMIALRQRAARNAGFPDYHAFAFAEKCRFDYTAEDCVRFHGAVEQVVVPVVRRMRERRARMLGVRVANLRPWDLAVDPRLRPPVRPFTTGDELGTKAARVFAHLDPVLGANFETMRTEELLDLESRMGKAPGGYCQTLSSRGRPFIFMNAVGVMDDVMTLLHEAGHAFHTFAAHPQPFIWQRHPGSEGAELASMSMELLALPHLATPGELLTDEQLRFARLEHLEDMLTSLLHIATVDAFQFWIYTSGQGHDAEARDAAWLALRQRFDPGVDWSGLTRERIARWYRQIHIFVYPLYYIEYGIAQLGAIQVWRRSLTDPSGALASYRAALALGGTRSLPELYRTAGAQLVFDPSRMASLVRFVEEAMIELRGE